ncbi:SGNH/GDSL hydrolase family protein [Aeromicrobium wangtongii]|uniref:SGNH/GDSL hydrolase family protein n=1 Tax=Aeromicrobium wangtongii TaxID=2969247 RepID=UPI0020172854|nr:SGNH/GDSL hydrolase family protein [Aeromicrobium wangtongii]MCL3817479.1 SGNH/GDSL hydrolase family protein [Aeromicrobium wangtongii]
MLRSLALSTAAVMLSPFALALPAHAAEPVAPGAGPRVAVIGDSITSWYRDEPGSISQGWWSMMGRDLGASVTILAEGGSGMNVRGNNCHGTTFGQRLKELTPVDFLVIEGGRNDMFGCNSRGQKTTLSRATQKKGIRTFMTRLAARTDALGIPRSHVLVISPWGKSDRKHGKAIQGYMRLFSNRKHNRFTYVETWTLPNHMTMDTKHPNRAGSAYLSSVVQRTIRSLS